MAFALAMGLVSAPATELSMNGSNLEHQAAQKAEPNQAGHDMSSMAEPCCDDCDQGTESGCQNSTMCLSACGKLPVQLGGLDNFRAPSSIGSLIPAEGSVLSGQILSPPRRPPKLA